MNEKGLLGSVQLLMVVGSLPGSMAWAQAPPAQQDQQRDVDQQKRIERELQSGALSTNEAGQLEKGEQRIDVLQGKDLAHEPVTPAADAKHVSVR